METGIQGHKLFEYLLRGFFHLLYNQLAWGYDFIAYVVSIGQWKEWILSISRDLDGPLVLEIGHGPGHLMTALKGSGVSIFGIDRSAYMGNIAYNRIAGSGYEPSLVRGIAANLPFRNATFNQLVATFPSKFILETTTINEAYRVLLPGGKFIILPLVWIQGRSLSERFLAYIFKITRQSPEWDEDSAKPVAEAGFILEFEERVVRSGKLLIIHAHKPSGL